MRFTQIYNLLCRASPERKEEFFGRADTLLKQHAEIFFIIAEELLEAGFFEEVPRPTHQRLSGCLAQHLQEANELVAADRVARLLGKVAEVLEDVVLAYSEVAPLLVRFLALATSAETKLEAGTEARLLQAFFEALDLLTDCGAKLFKHSLHEIVALVKAALQANKLQPEHLDLLRQIALNFSYDLSARILAKPETTADLIWVVVSGLVDSLHQDPGV